jgi:hypothetical protein
METKMTNENKPRPFIIAPAVIDWLQWSDEFREELGRPDYPQLTLSLIAEYKSALTALEVENKNLRKALDASGKENILVVMKLKKRRTKCI